MLISTCYLQNWLIFESELYSGVGFCSVPGLLDTRARTRGRGGMGPGAETQVLGPMDLGATQTRMSSTLLTLFIACEKVRNGYKP